MPAMAHGSAWRQNEQKQREGNGVVPLSDNNPPTAAEPRRLWWCCGSNKLLSSAEVLSRFGFESWSTAASQLSVRVNGSAWFGSSYEVVRLTRSTESTRSTQTRLTRSTKITQRSGKDLRRDYL
ncbi:hypothetical protein HanPSC8_Chr17g0779131 [Helianthus annuus]|nr:hypothetical protein HanIR_Chr17g0881091 [Helianthus annuus]KAJ0813908.1 hypothetical protein HanPSC8_Chr17g0779131 [Helianthus annuus]